MDKRSERVKVIGPGGRTTWISRRAAEHPDGFIGMVGYRVLDDMLEEVPELGGKQEQKRGPGRPPKQN
jgi:hypothetical protein